MSTFGFLAASKDPNYDPGEEEFAGAPGMMSFDDMDEDFIDEDNI